jgi:hypothetical protein
MAEVFVLSLGCYLRVLSLDLPLFSLLASQLFKNFLAPREALAPAGPREAPLVVMGIFLTCRWKSNDELAASQICQTNLCYVFEYEMMKVIIVTTQDSR